MHSIETYDAATKLLAKGMSIAAVARALGVPRATVGHWRRRPGYRPRQPRIDGAWRPPDGPAYAYLLGMYLGDGNLLTHGSSAVLRITLDLAHPEIADEATVAIGATIPGISVCRYEWPHRGRLVVLQASSAVWPHAFPQHGPGKKHERAIRLEPWQRGITHRHPRELVRGLIHSDGCRSVNRFRTRLPSGRVAEYAYARYFFSNLSEDIKDVFCEHCDLLGVAWSRANPRHVSIHDRRSVALLDSFVGPKS